MKKIIRKQKFLKRAGIMFLIVALILTSATVIANTEKPESLSIIEFKNKDSEVIRLDEIIWDNGVPGTSVLASQYDAAYPFNAQTADDFMFEDGATITGVGFYGGFWSGDDDINPCDFNIYIYNDDGSGTSPTGGGTPNPETTAIASYLLEDIEGVEVGDRAYQYEVTLPEEFVAESGIKYWIAIQAVFNFPPQWGWFNTDDPMHLSEAVQGFPSLEKPFWTPTAKGDQSFVLLGETSSQPSPELDVISIGPLFIEKIGIVAEIKNIGEESATGVDISIDIEGGLFNLIKNKSISVETLAAGESVEIKMIPIGFGLGIIFDKPLIKITADSAETDPISESVTIKIIGPFVLFD